MGQNTNFITTELANKINHAKSEIIGLYKANDYDEDANNLIDELSKAISDSIKIVFIGQYTAGKSTIISALTGNREIAIDSDVSTSEITDYNWGGVIVTDTPGLYTGNTEHDEKTRNMIKQSDLLVYCITSDLFNQYTLEDFKNLAFNMNYAGKMFLVINKMSKEDGTYDSLCNNYTSTLNASLEPHTINEFSHSFVDAKDYKDGKKENDTELIAYSRFNNFVSSLNAFVAQKGILGKLDKPIMIMKDSIDKVSEKITDNESQKSYTSLLSRIERKVEQQRNNVSIHGRNLIRSELKPIVDMGYNLSRKIGIEDVDVSERDVNEIISSSCERINNGLDLLCNDAVDELNKEINDVLSSETASYFFNSISGVYSEKRSLFESKESKSYRAQFDCIKNTVEKITGETIKLATKGSSAGYLIKSTEAAGSQMHKAIYSIGKTIGYKFKPWQAANITKCIGNIAKVLGPAVGVVGVLFDFKEIVDENEKDTKIQKAQLECRQEFLDIASDLESQYSYELSKLINVYDDVLDNLQKNREKVQNAIQSDDKLNQKLQDIRKELVSIQTSIF